MEFDARTRASRRSPAKPFALASTALAAAMLFAAGGADAAPPQRSSEGPWAKGRLLIVAKPGLSPTEVGKVAGAERGKAARIGQSHVYVIDLPPQASETAVRARLKNNPHIEAVEFDQLVPLNSSNDPYYGSQWHLSKTGAASAWPTTTGSGVTIAILDTGVDGSHADLKDRMVAGYNFYDGNTDTRDVHGHGTAVAGTAAATLNNGTGVASVAGAAKIMPIRVSDLQGYGSWSAFTQGLTWAADRGARVANISYLVSGSSSVQSAASYFKSKGGLVVTSAGNYGKDEGIAPSDTLISVSATSSSDSLASWSSYGKFVDISAPGAGIYTTTRGGGYASWNGTSFSSPVAGGVIALMMAANPKLSAAEVEKLLFQTTVDLGSAGFDIYHGWGRVNAYAAVQAALEAGGDTTPTDAQAPVASITNPVGGSTVSGLVPVDVSASDDTGVARVDLYANGSKVASDSAAPFAFSWDSTKVANGTVGLHAVAVDAAGNAGTAQTVNVNVSNVTTPPPDTQAPVASISSPTGGSTVSGQVTVSVSATDNTGVARVDVYVNGSKVGSDSSSPFSISWDSTKATNGTALLQAVAVDAAGNAGQSATVSVKVSNTTTTTGADTTSPVVAITNPGNGATVGGRSVTIKVSASDDSGATKISQQLFIDGAQVASTTGGSLSYTWDLRKVSKGAHTIEALATDAAGNKSRHTISVTR